MADHPVSDPERSSVRSLLGGDERYGCAVVDPTELVVTTSLKASQTVSDLAMAKADDWGLSYVDRSGQSMDTIVDDGRSAAVFTSSGLHIATPSGRLHSHLGTAHIRLHSLRRGDGDPLVRAAELRPGDQVLDTTYGLGRDSVVAAHAVGPTGSVLGLESSAALFHLSDESPPLGFAGLLPAPIQLVRADARRWLESAESASVDVVLVDPMFKRPKAADAGFDLLRWVADETPLDREWIEHARRVARRCVVLKSGEALPWFGDEELQRVRSHSNAALFCAPSSADPPSTAESSRGCNSES
ncbi:MAG: 16S rRNA (guanine1516-N2)-methyltransferase [Verrucomicrobiales bacterium]|jgi:16S rRNA (guanine1516-N2)-methyltransferase